MAQAAGNKADNSTLEKIRNSVTIEDAIIAAGTFLSPDTDINGNWATYEDADGNTILYDKNTGTTKPVTHNADGSIQYDTFTDANGVNWNMGGWAADETKSTQMQAVSDRIGKLTDENIDAKVAEFAPGLTSDMIREASAQSGVSWEALLAMVSQEATIGGEMSNVANKNNNFGGLKWSENTQWKEAPYNGTIGTARPGKEGGNYTKFPSKQEGLNAMASLMSQYGTVADTPDDKQILIDSVISNVNKGILTLDQALKQNPKLKNEIQLGVAKNIEQLNNAVLQDLDNKMQLTENLFDHPGLDAAVGTSIYTRAGKFDLRPGTVWDKHITGNYQDFLATMEQLVSEKALSSLIEAKEKGATFGALSEGEMAILKAAATKLGPLEIRDKNGKLTGYNASEKTVKAELKKVQAAYESLYYGTVLENNFKQFPDKIDEYNSLVATYPGISNKELNELIDFN